MPVTAFDDPGTLFDDPGTLFDGSSAPVPVVPPPPPIPQQPLPAVPVFTIVDEDTLEAVVNLWNNASVAAPAVCVDDDTIQAVVSLWLTAKVTDTTGMACQLPQLFTKPPTFGRAKSPATPNVYAVVSIALERRELVGVLGPWFDWRRVKFESYGDIKADVVNAAGAILAVFNRNLGRTDMAGFATLTFPSGARFMSWQPVGEIHLEEDKDTARGKDVWKATLEALVWSVRPL